jgi:RimJ/RimL family protein N-acetyltransferase
MLEHSTPVSVPDLQTRRLTLREYRMGDFEAYVAHLADHYVFGVLDRRQAWQHFSSNMGGWLLQGAGWWAIELRESGKLVGNVGAFFRETRPEIEIGWNTFREYWSQGIASEAAAEVLRYVFEVRGDRRAMAMIDAQNTASRRVAARIGMTYEADMDFFGMRLGRYVRAAPTQSASPA